LAETVQIIMRTAGFDSDDAVTFAHIALVHAIGSAQAEANVRTYDPDQQHEIMTEIFVDGLRAQLTRRRPSQSRCESTKFGADIEARDFAVALDVLTVAIRIQIADASPNSRLG